MTAATFSMARGFDPRRELVRIVGEAAERYRPADPRAVPSDPWLSAAVTVAWPVLVVGRSK